MLASFPDPDDESEKDRSLLTIKSALSTKDKADTADLAKVGAGEKETNSVAT